MALVTFPSQNRFRAFGWRLSAPAQVNRSAYTGARQVMGLAGGGRWACEIEFVPLVGEDAAAAWRGFLASLDGPVNSVYVPSAWDQHGGPNPTCTAGPGAVTVDLSAAVGLKAGQYMTFALPSGRKQMVILTADMAGTTAHFRPALREAIAGATVETVNPFAEMALGGDEVSWQHSPGAIYALSTLSLEEAY